METETIKKSQFRLTRLFSLDIIRGIAAFFMVNGHFIYDTMSKDPRLWATKSFFFMAENFIYTVGWTMFFLIIGMGLAISSHRYKSKGLPFEERLIHILKRTGILVLIQYVYNLVSFGFLSSDYYRIYFGPYSSTDFTYFFNPISSFSHSNLIAQIGLWSFVVFFLMELPIVVRVVIAAVLAYLGFYVFAVKGNMILYILI
ncbi:MAG: heparan-alpha-glucosaminide N-acetyltransferase domain-containing protein, partial [Candidatus Hodarchaeota archaeon]